MKVESTITVLIKNNKAKDKEDICCLLFASKKGWIYLHGETLESAVNIGRGGEGMKVGIVEVLGGGGGSSRLLHDHCYCAPAFKFRDDDCLFQSCPSPLYVG